MGSEDKRGQNLATIASHRPDSVAYSATKSFVVTFGSARLVRAAADHGAKDVQSALQTAFVTSHHQHDLAHVGAGFHTTVGIIGTCKRERAV